jgi:3-oxoadipate enol-lactonase
LTKREAAVAALPRSWFVSFAGLCDAFLRIDLTKDLARIVCPTLVLVAENDILKGERFARIIAENVRGARLRVILDAGHAVVVERPAEVAAEICAFLDGLPGRSPGAAR